MSNPSIFQFKQFSINQAGAAMKVGTDGMLLGAWVKPDNAETILDIGTGNGLVALMLAQRSNAFIDGFEIEGSAYQQARENFENSQWNRRLMPHHSDIKLFANRQSKKYDLIVSNPPFFEDNKQSKISKGRMIARTTNTLSPDALLKCVAQLLEPQGRFYVIIPFEGFARFKVLALLHGLSLFDTLNIKSYSASEYIRAIAGFSFKAPEAVVKDELIIYDSPGKYSNAYISLTKDYYAKDLTSSAKGYSGK